MKQQIEYQKLIHTTNAFIAKFIAKPESEKMGTEILKRFAAEAQTMWIQDAARLRYHVCRPHYAGYGIHSPFVYRLTRDLLRRKGKGVAGGDTLAERLAAWLPCRTAVLPLPAAAYDRAAGREPGCACCAEGDLTQADVAAPLHAPGAWREHDVLVLHRIHATTAARNAWQALLHQPGVTVTIDLWDTGLVFFDRRLHPQQFVIFAPRRLRR